MAAYDKVHEAWHDAPVTDTPIDAAALDQIEEGIATAQDTADTAVTAAAAAQATADASEGAAVQANLDDLIATMTTDGDIMTRAAGVPARITRADLAADAAFAGTYVAGLRPESYATLQEAITAAAAAGVPLILGATTYTVSSALTFPDNLQMCGQGRGVTTIKRAFTGDFVTSVGAGVRLQNLSIDGDTATHGAGTGMLVPAGKHSQMFDNVEVENFVEPCLEFAADGGSGFTAIASYFVTTGTVGTVGAVTVAGTDSAAVPRYFIGCSGVGSTLFDFGGCNDFFVLGGFSAPLIFGAASDKVSITSMRVQAGAQTIKGSSHHIVGTTFGGAVTLDATTQNCVFDANQVPDYDVTDSGTGNWVSFKNRLYTPTWTGASTDPVLGDGTIDGTWSRQGNTVSVDINLTMGSTTTYGSGNFQFGLPVAPRALSTYKIGTAWLYNGTVAAGIAYINPGTNFIVIWIHGETGVASASVPWAWGNGHQIKVHIEYETP